MLNKEKYAKEILDIVCREENVGRQNGCLYPCSKISCSNCEFDTTKNCSKGFSQWANSEYKEREIDWSKVPVDTRILIIDSYGNTIKRYFAKYYNKKFYAYPNGATSWSFNQDSDQLIDWNEKNVQIEEGVDCSEWYKD